MPYGDVMELLNALTFPADHPYGHTTIGSMEDLDAATLEDVHAFFRRHYLPNNAVLSIVGDVEPDDAFERPIPASGISQPVPSRPNLAAGPLDPLSDNPRTETSGKVPADAVYLTWRVPAREGRISMQSTSPSASSGTVRHRGCISTWSVVPSRESTGASTMGLIGGNSFGFSYARARDGVAPEQLEQEIVELIDQLISDGPTEDELRQSPVRAPLVARAGASTRALMRWVSTRRCTVIQPDQLTDCRDHRHRQRRRPGGHAAMVPAGPAGKPDLSAGGVMRDFLPRPAIAPAAVWTFPTEARSAQ